MIRIVLSNPVGTTHKKVTINIKDNVTMGELREEAIKAFDLKDPIENYTQLVSTYGNDVLDVQDKDNSILINTLNISDCSLFSVVNPINTTPDDDEVVVDESELSLASCFVLLAAKKDTETTLQYISDHLEEFLALSSFPSELDKESLISVIKLIEEPYECYKAVYDWAKSKQATETKSTLGDIIRNEGLLGFMRILDFEEEDLAKINDNSIVSEKQQFELFKRTLSVGEPEHAIISDTLKEFSNVKEGEKTKVNN